MRDKIATQRRAEMNGAAFVRSMADDGTAGVLLNVGFEIVPAGGTGNRYDLRLKGLLMPGWAGRLTAGLAKQGVSIVRGEAEKVTLTAWTSKFQLQFPRFGADPLSLDYAALAKTELPQERPMGKISLLDYAMQPSEQHEGSLYLELRGVDRVGLLGDLLDYFSMRCLFPVKMSVETVESTALDRFWLKGVGGSRPSSAIAEAIKENLDRLLLITN
jgi:hypothetical protein